MKKTAIEILMQEYGGSKNFMTDMIVKRGKVSRNIAYELSKGTGFSGQDMFGVSVVAYFPETDSTKRFSNVNINGQDISSVFSSLFDANDHIECLQDIGEEKLLAALSAKD